MTKRYREEAEVDGTNLANILILLLRGSSSACSSGRVFECKTCSRRFESFQALGGHRASHKKPRTCQQIISEKKDKVHECSVCGLAFAMGQALGGHMRRHRAVSDGGFVEKKRVVLLDLNFPPLEFMEEDVEIRKSIGLGFGSVRT